MAVVGIDFGTLHSKIGVARRGGIDVIVNEVSNRQTPSLVAFGPKQRSIGESAKTQETSNFKNTIGSLKRLAGRSLNDPQVQDYEKKFINAKLIDIDGTVGTEVNYLGEKHQFTATQLVAMYLGKLRDIAVADIKNTFSDVVIAVPGWYTDSQRRAVLDAASIAGLNTLRLINDTTAVALGYGITKSDLPEAENPRHVAFVDVGHSSLSVAIVDFSKGQLTVRATAYDRNLGGRDIDYALVKHFSEEFKTKYKIDVLSNPKATFRLVAGCEKLKKVLSANAEAPLNVESIMNDIDASSKLTRDELEALISEVTDRIEGPLKRALEASDLTVDQIDAVELIGGSTRVPSVRAKIQSIFPGKSLSTTLNQDEAIARGATFSCATLSPMFRVRDFAIGDITPYNIQVQWAASATDPEEDTELLVFGRGNAIPSTKVLTFYRKETFEIEARYAEPSEVTGQATPVIARFTATDVPVDPRGDLTAVRLKTRLNAHGVLSFAGAYTEELEEKDDPNEIVADGEEPKKKKKVIKKKDIPFTVKSASLEPAAIEELKEKENQMHSADKLVMDTEDRKNALEEYVYDTRSKLDERLAPFVQAEEKQKLLAILSEAEDWLYTEEGEDATKSAYVTRLDAAKVLGDPVNSRYIEFETRPRAMAALRETIDKYMADASSTAESLAHIAEADKQSVIEKAATIQKWLEDQNIRQQEKPRNVDPVLRVKDIEKKRDELIYFATPILSKPKPKPPVIPTDTPKSGAQTPNPEAQAPPPPAEEPAKGPSEMDVD